MSIWEAYIHKNKVLTEDVSRTHPVGVSVENGFA